MSDAVGVSIMAKSVKRETPAKATTASKTPVTKKMAPAKAQPKSCGCKKSK
jgi:hypothetical protein